MWLVTIEAEDCSWLEDPEAFDFEGEAIEYASKINKPEGSHIMLYHCRDVAEL